MSNWYTIKEAQIEKKKEALLKQKPKGWQDSTWEDTVDWALRVGTLHERAQGKYANWLLNLIRGNPDEFTFGEDDQKVQESIRLFESVKKRQDFDSPKDLNAYKEFGALLEAVRPFQKSGGAREERRKAIEEGLDKIDSKDGFSLYHILNFEASHAIAQPTGWCVSQKEYYNEYNDDGPLYYFTRSGGTPYALFHEYTGQFKNINDNVMTDIETMPLLNLLIDNYNALGLDDHDYDAEGYMSGSRDTLVIQSAIGKMKLFIKEFENSAKEGKLPDQFYAMKENISLTSSSEFHMLDKKINQYLAILPKVKHLMPEGEYDKVINSYAKKISGKLIGFYEKEKLSYEDVGVVASDSESTRASAHKNVHKYLEHGLLQYGFSLNKINTKIQDLSFEIIGLSKDAILSISDDLSNRFLNTVDNNLETLCESHNLMGMISSFQDQLDALESKKINKKFREIVDKIANKEDIGRNIIPFELDAGKKIKTNKLVSKSKETWTKELEKNPLIYHSELIIPDPLYSTEVLQIALPDKVKESLSEEELKSMFIEAYTKDNDFKGLAEGIEDISGRNYQNLLASYLPKEVLSHPNFEKAIINELRKEKNPILESIARGGRSLFDRISRSDDTHWYFYTDGIKSEMLSILNRDLASMDSIRLLGTVIEKTYDYYVYFRNSGYLDDITRLVEGKIISKLDSLNVDDLKEFYNENFRGTRGLSIDNELNIFSGFENIFRTIQSSVGKESLMNLLLRFISSGKMPNVNYKSKSHLERSLNSLGNVFKDLKAIKPEELDKALELGISSYYGTNEEKLVENYLGRYEFGNNEESPGPYFEKLLGKRVSTIVQELENDGTIYKNPFTFVFVRDYRDTYHLMEIPEILNVLRKVYDRDKSKINIDNFYEVRLAYRSPKVNDGEFARTAFQYQELLLENVINIEKTIINQFIVDIVSSVNAASEADKRCKDHEEDVDWESMQSCVQYSRQMEGVVINNFEKLKDALKILKDKSHRIGRVLDEVGKEMGTEYSTRYNSLLDATQLELISYYITEHFGEDPNNRLYWNFAKAIRWTM